MLTFGRLKMEAITRLKPLNSAKHDGQEFAFKGWRESDWEYHLQYEKVNSVMFTQNLRSFILFLMEFLTFPIQ